MAFRAGVLERVAGETGSDIEHSRTGVATAFEDRQRNVASGQFIVAAAAIIHRVASRAIPALERGILAVNVVLPAGRVRHGFHHEMAGSALSLGLHRWRHVLVAHETLGVRRGGFILVMDAETLGMKRRLYVSGVAGGSAHALHGIGVAGGAVRHPEFGGNTLRGIVTLDAIQHAGQGKVR